MERTRKRVCLVTVICLVMTAPCLLSAEPLSKTISRPALGIVPMKKLSITLDVDKPDRVFEASDPIKMKFVMKNESKTPIRVLIWGTPLEGLNSNLFDITGPDGEKVPYLGKIVSRPEPDPEKDYITIQPGKSIEKEIDITEAYHIDKEGPYSLTHNFKMLDLKLIKGPGAAPEMRSRAPIELQPVRFQQKKGIRQKTPRKSLQEAPPVRPPARMYSQGPNQMSSDLPAYAGTRKCKLSHVLLPQYATTDNDRKAELNEAFCEALKLAAEAKVTLSGTPGQEIESGADRYRAYFGDAGKKDVLSVFGTIHTFGFPTQGSPVQFYDVPSEVCRSVVAEAESRYIAFVMGDDVLTNLRKIYLCPLFWTLSDVRFSKSRIVLHEMSHLTRGAEYGTIPKPGYRARVWDYNYFESGCMYLAQNDPEHSAFNADSFALFAHNRNDLHMGLDRPYIKLTKTTGESLVVENKILRVRSNADPSRNQFAVSSPKESSLIYPSAANNACKEMSEFFEKCGNCNDPDVPLAESADCYNGACSCVVQIDRNWKPFTPAFGDVVALITGNRASVLDAPETTDKPVCEAELTDSAKGLRLVKASAGSGGLADGAQVYLQTTDGLYLSEADDGTIITKKVTTPGEGERFSISFSRQGRYYLQMRTESKGWYIRTREDLLGRSITADVEVQDSAGCADCTFILMKQDQEPLKSGDVINIMTYDGNFVYASNETLWGFVRADGTTSAIPQSFIIQKVDPGDDYTIETGDVVYLFSKAEDGKYPVWTSPEGKGQLYASNNPGVEEPARRFIIEIGR